MRDMSCRNCDYMYTNETMNDLYICVNGASEMLGQFVGICSDAQCPDCWNKDIDAEITEAITNQSPNYFGEY